MDTEKQEEFEYIKEGFKKLENISDEDGTRLYELIANGNFEL